MTENNWDKKKENFFRIRVRNLLAAEADSEIVDQATLKEKGSIKELGKMESQANCDPLRKEELKLLHHIVDLLPFLHSEVHDLFHFSPSKMVMREHNALLTQKVPYYKYPSGMETLPTDPHTPDLQPPSNQDSASQQKSLLHEVELLLPYFMLSADFKLV